jgi:hypothetical protein
MYPRGAGLEIDIKGRRIVLQKELTIYDRLALDFAFVLNRHGISYAYVSGYVAILFGRSRTSEDIDLLVVKMPFEQFSTLWKSLKGKFYCHNTDDVKTAYYEYLGEKTALRFSRKDSMLPNIEFKWAVTEQHRRALSNSLNVCLSGRELIISSLEMQIAFKIFLRSDKDLEDARYLFELFRDRLDTNELKKEIRDLGISLRKAKEDIGW